MKNVLETKRYRLEYQGDLLVVTPLTIQNQRPTVLNRDEKQLYRQHLTRLLEDLDRRFTDAVDKAMDEVFALPNGPKQ